MSNTGESARISFTGDVSVVGRLAAEEARVSVSCSEDLLCPWCRERRERGERELAEGDLVNLLTGGERVGGDGEGDSVARGCCFWGGVEGGITSGEEGERWIERVGVVGEGESGEAEGEREGEGGVCLVAEATVDFNLVATIMARCL